MASRKKKKRDTGTVIFWFIGIEVIILATVFTIVGILVVPTILSRFNVSLSSLLPHIEDKSTVSEEVVPGQVPDQNTPDNQYEPEHRIEQIAVGEQAGEQQSIQQTQEKIEQTSAIATTESPEPEEVLSTARLVAAGDNKMGRFSTLSAKQNDGIWYFYNHFVNVSDLFTEADLAVISQDTVTAGEEYGLSDGEIYNTVPELLDALSDTGIDVVLAANDHILDKGRDGLEKMIGYMHSSHPEMTLLGVNENGQQQNAPVFVEVNGIRIAMINYTCEAGQAGPLDAEPFLVNLDNEEWLADMIARSKADADFVIVFPHWGERDNPGITQEQESEAQLLADLGADLIIGSYPGVVSTAQWIKGSGGNDVFVYYSLGYFQSTEVNTANMLGALANITLTKTSRRTYIDSCGMDFLVTYYSQNADENSGVVTTFPWDSFTPELTERHGIRSWDPGFTYEALDDLRKNILAGCSFKR